MAVVADFFSINSANFNIVNTEKTFAKFCVKKNNTIDFMMMLAINITDSISISLKKNAVIVATASIDTDVRERSLFWREKVSTDSIFELTFKRTSTKGTSSTIYKHNFQWGF